MMTCRSAKKLNFAAPWFQAIKNICPEQLAKIWNFWFCHRREKKSDCRRKSAFWVPVARWRLLYSNGFSGKSRTAFDRFSNSKLTKSMRFIFWHIWALPVFGIGFGVSGILSGPSGSIFLQISEGKTNENKELMVGRNLACTTLVKVVSSKLIYGLPKPSKFGEHSLNQCFKATCAQTLLGSDHFLELT